ncbi:MAG: gamma-glutamyl-phosphate reductase, partial [Actinomycetes bacterium]
MTEALTHTTAENSGDTTAAAATQPVASTATQAPADVPLSSADVEAAVHAIADRSRHAARRMAMANRSWKDRALRAVGAALQENAGAILSANARDVASGKANGT